MKRERRKPSAGVTAANVTARQHQLKQLAEVGPSGETQESSFSTETLAALKQRRPFVVERIAPRLKSGAKNNDAATAKSPGGKR
jgi:hypothetical protein